MEQFWQIALSIAGLGAIGAFVFWSLYQGWLKLPIFANLTQNQTYYLMWGFLIFTFVFALVALLTHTKNQYSSPKTTEPKDAIYDAKEIIKEPIKNVEVRDEQRQNVFIRTIRIEFYNVSDDKDENASINVKIRAKGQTIATASNLGKGQKIQGGASPPAFQLSMSGKPVPASVLDEGVLTQLNYVAGGRDIWKCSVRLIADLSDGSTRRMENPSQLDFTSQNPTIQLPLH
jgi:hypothetical protein